MQGEWISSTPLAYIVLAEQADNDITLYKYYFKKK